MKQNKFIKKSEIEKYNIDSTSEENIIFRDSSNFEEISSPNGNVFNVLWYCRGEKSTLSMFRYDSNDTTTLLKRYDYWSKNPLYQNRVYNACTSCSSCHGDGSCGGDGD